MYCSKHGDVDITVLWGCYVEACHPPSLISQSTPGSFGSSHRKCSLSGTEHSLTRSKSTESLVLEALFYSGSGLWCVIYVSHGGSTMGTVAGYKVLKHHGKGQTGTSNRECDMVSSHWPRTAQHPESHPVDTNVMLLQPSPVFGLE